MRKPIFVVKLPLDATEESMDKHYAILEKKLGAEYHVLVARVDVDDVEFQQFDESNIKPADLESLKKELRLKAKPKQDDRPPLLYR